MALLDQVIGQLIGAVNILGDDGIGFVGSIVDVHIHFREINLCNLLPDTLSFYFYIPPDWITVV